MIHYLKKQWRLSTLTCLFAIIAYGAQALIQLALMKIFDAVVLLDLRSTIFWTAVDLTCWGRLFSFYCFTGALSGQNNSRFEQYGARWAVSLLPAQEPYRFSSVRHRRISRPADQ